MCGIAGVHDREDRGRVDETSARIDLTVTVDGRTVLGKAQVVVATGR